MVERLGFNELVDINPKIVTKDQLEKFKIIIETSIIESIICGF